MNALCLQHWHLRLKCRLVIERLISDNFQLLADSTLTDFQDVSNWKSKYPMNQSFCWFQNEIAFPWCGSCEWVVEHGWKKIHYRYFPINNLTLIYQSTTRTGAFSWGSVETLSVQIKIISGAAWYQGCMPRLAPCIYALFFAPPRPMT